MKFSIEKSILLNSLQQLNKAIPPRSTLPVLSNILFESGDGILELRTTDLEISITIRLPIQSDGKTKIAIPIHKLLEITNEMPEGNIDFEISDVGKVIIKSAYGKYTIMGESADNYPSKQIITDAREISLQSELLQKIIEHTTYAVSREEIKPALQGVYFQIHENMLRIVSTDGHRLVRYTINDVTSENFQGEVIIPAKFLSIIKNYLPPNKAINLLMDQHHVKISLDETTISTRIIDQKYPDYENVIPTDNDKKIIVDRAEFLASVRRVSIFSNKSTRQIILSISENKMVISTEDPENITTGKETINCKFSGEPLSISYNAAYLKEVLMHQNSDEILIKLKTTVSAGIFIPQNSEDDIITLLMPIR